MQRMQPFASTGSCGFPFTISDYLAKVKSKSKQRESKHICSFHSALKRRPNKGPQLRSLNATNQQWYVHVVTKVIIPKPHTYLFSASLARQSHTIARKDERWSMLCIGISAAQLNFQKYAVPAAHEPERKRILQEKLRNNPDQQRRAGDGPDKTRRLFISQPLLPVVLELCVTLRRDASTFNRSPCSCIE